MCWPFYIRDKGFVTAAELAVGDEFRTQTGTWASSTSKADPGIVEPVYNLQVNDGHTYFVCTGDGKTSVLVHNDSAPDGQGGFWSSVWMCTKAAATRTDQFAGQVVTAACTGQWVDADTTSGLGYGGTYYGSLGNGAVNLGIGAVNTGEVAYYAARRPCDRAGRDDDHRRQRSREELELALQRVVADRSEQPAGQPELLDRRWLERGAHRAWSRNAW